MSGSKIVAMAGGLIALLTGAASSAAPQQACSLGTEYPVVSVSPYKRQAETGGYGGTVNRVLRGADIRVAAQPGLTAEWLQRQLEAQVAAGECQLGAGSGVRRGRARERGARGSGHRHL